MKYLRAFLSSMTGHLFFLLLGGMLVAALLAGVISNFNSARESQRQSDERTADRLQAFLSFLDTAPEEFRARLLRRNESGVRSHPLDTAGLHADPAFARLLAARGGLLAAASVDEAATDACESAFGMQGPPRRWRGPMGPEMPANLPNLRGAGPDVAPFEPGTCRLVSVSLGDGTPLRLSIDSPRARAAPNRLFDPAFVTMLGAGIVLLAYLVAHRAAAPLRRLAQASTQLGQDLHRKPLAVKGPAEVRQAVMAFNSMQAQLQGHFAQRTQMLAAITHDLQTPLTRLRLRLERVPDAELRERLIADMQAMRALIDEGLELARTAEAPEAVVMLDLDSVLESLVEDANEAGLPATFAAGCGAVLPLRPLATRRVFSNLIDNALSYGGSAEVRAVRDRDSLSVFVRDHGPGMPQEILARAFEPFFRAEGSRSRETGGTGLGLTIARMLAARIGATLTLRNHPERGLEAEVKWNMAELLSAEG